MSYITVGISDKAIVRSLVYTEIEPKWVAAIEVGGCQGVLYLTEEDARRVITDLQSAVMTWEDARNVVNL